MAIQAEAESTLEMSYLDVWEYPRCVTSKIIFSMLYEYEPTWNLQT